MGFSALTVEGVASRVGIIAGVTIEHNFLAGNGAGGGAAINLDGARDTLVRGNILLDNRSTSVAMFRVDGGTPTTGTRILDNLIVGAADSRALLIFANGSARNLVQGNVLIARNASVPLLSVNDVAMRGPIAQLRGEYAMPAVFTANRYAWLGPLATYGEREVLEDLPEWGAAAGDTDSRVLEVDRALIQAEDPRVLHRALYNALRSAPGIADNPHFDRLLADTRGGISRR